MQSIALLFIMAALSLKVLPQTPPAIQWQNTIGGNHADGYPTVRQTSDGGYIVGGFSNSTISGDITEGTHGALDYWIIKINATGSVQWQNTIGGSSGDELHAIQQTSDSGYILGGTSLSNASGDKTESSNGDFDYWIVKTDASGSIEWQNTIGGSDIDDLRSIEQTADGGYIIGGWSISPLSGDKTENGLGNNDYWIVKTDAEGAIEWQNTIGGSMDDRLYSVHQTADGGYMLSGSSNSNITGDKTENTNGAYDYWIIKTDATGNIQWQNTIGGSSYDEIRAFEQTADGGYILVGNSTSPISGDKTEGIVGAVDYWIVKTDADGNVEWQKNIGGSDFDFPDAIQQTADGGYIVAGSSNSNISGDKTQDSRGAYDYWVVKTDAVGTLEWQSTIGGSADDELESVQQCADGSYVLGGQSNSPLSGEKTENSLGDIDYWIVKLEPDNTTSIADLPAQPFRIALAPNPVTDQLTMTSSGARIIGLEVLDALGQRVRATQTLTNERFRLVDVSRLPSGMYSVQVKTTEGQSSALFVKE